MKILLVGGDRLAEQLNRTLGWFMQIPADIIRTEIHNTWEAAQKENPDMVILDLEDAGEALKVVRNVKKLDEDIQVMILAGVRNKNLDKVIKEGADGLLMKPYAEAELAAMIKTAVKSRRQANEFHAKGRILEEVELSRILMDSSPDWEYLLDTQGNHTYVSPACEQLTGYQPEEFMKDPGFLVTLTHPDDRASLLEHIKSSMQSSEPLSMDFRIIHRDGKIRWISHLCQPLYDKEGILLGRRASNRDITEQKGLEKALTENEATLRQITENMRDLISQTDERGVFSYISPSHRHVLGFKQEDMLGKSAFDFIHPEDVENILMIFQEGLERKIPDSAEFRFRHAKGHYTWVETLGRVIQNAKEEVVGAIFTSRDITERKSAAKELDLLFHLSRNMMCVADFNGFLIRVNPSWEKTLGWTPDELMSQPYLEFVHPDDRESTVEAAQGLIEGKPAVNFNNRYRCKNGSYRWLSWNSAPLAEKGLVYCVVHDVTDIKKAEEALRKAYDELEIKVAERTAELSEANEDLQAQINKRIQMEEALTESERRYALVVDNLPNGRVHIVDKDYRFVFSAGQGHQKMEMSVKDFQGKTPHDLFSAKAADIIICNYLRAFDGEDVTYTVEHNRRAFLSNAIPIINENGLAEQLIVLSIDITEQKRAEEKLRKLNEELGQRVKMRTAQLEASNKELEAFAYSVSHDLRAPLRAVMGFSNMLMEEYADKLDSEGIRLLNVVCENAQKMDQLITNLLELSRFSRTKMKPALINMESLVQSVYKEILPPKEGSFEFSLAPLPDSVGDEPLIRQVWLNLLSNAIKYSMPKEVRKIEVGSYVENGMNVYFVKDNGVGFNSSYTDKLFGIFQRLHRSKEFDGTGIGLAIVQRIIHRQGGQVWAKGEVNEGATFYFSLPIMNLDSKNDKV